MASIEGAADVPFFRRREARRKKEDVDLVKGDQALSDLRDRVQKIKTYNKVVTIRIKPKAE